MSQDQENLDLMQEGIDELEGSVDLKTALAQEKAKEKSDKEAAKKEKSDKEAAKFAEKVKKDEERIAAKQAKLDEKEAKAAEKEAAKAAKLEAKSAPKITQDKQNGITRPKLNTSCGKIWEICTKLSNEKGELVLKKEVSASSLSSEFHPTTVGVQYYKWKKFHGIG